MCRPLGRSGHFFCSTLFNWVTRYEMFRNFVPIVKWFRFTLCDQLDDLRGARNYTLWFHRSNTGIKILCYNEKDRIYLKNAYPLLTCVRPLLVSTWHSENYGPGLIERIIPIQETAPQSGRGPLCFFVWCWHFRSLWSSSYCELVMSWRYIVRTKIRYTKWSFHTGKTENTILDLKIEYTRL